MEGRNWKVCRRTLTRIAQNRQLWKGLGKATFSSRFRKDDDDDDNDDDVDDDDDNDDDVNDDDDYDDDDHFAFHRYT